MLKSFDELLGHTLSKVVVSDNNEELIFTLGNEEQYKLFHYEDCCEHVYIEDIIGNLDDLVGLPLTMAEEITNANKPENAKIKYRDNSETWTFYKLATVKGYVTIRWHGSSNGYYSESVDFCSIN